MIGGLPNQPYLNKNDSLTNNSLELQEMGSRDVEAEFEAMCFEENLDLHHLGCTERDNCTTGKKNI